MTTSWFASLKEAGKETFEFHDALAFVRALYAMQLYLGVYGRDFTVYRGESAEYDSPFCPSAWRMPCDRTVGSQYEFELDLITHWDPPRSDRTPPDFVTRVEEVKEWASQSLNVYKRDPQRALSELTMSPGQPTPAWISHLSMAQHYDCKTRLLDVTSDPLIAAKFASAPPSTESRYLVVWAYSHQDLTTTAKIFPHVLPSLIFPIEDAANDRGRSQRGLVLFFSTHADPSARFEPRFPPSVMDRPVLRELKLCRSQAQNLEVLLDAQGVSFDLLRLEDKGHVREDARSWFEKLQVKDDILTGLTQTLTKIGRGEFE